MYIPTPSAPVEVSICATALAKAFLEVSVCEAWSNPELSPQPPTAMETLVLEPNSDLIVEIGVKGVYEAGPVLGANARTT